MSSHLLSLKQRRAFSARSAVIALSIALIGPVAASAQPTPVGSRGITDCNDNGVDDALDIDPTDPDGNGEVSPDCNADLRPDECEFPRQLAKIAPTDGSSGDRFGYDISASSNAAIVGAPREDTGGQDAGAAYIFRFDGSSWQEEQKLIASDATSGAEFGIAVSIDGDVAIIGSNAPNGVSGDGCAYVFRFNGVSWVEEQKLIPSGIDAMGGVDVSHSGNVAFIGFPKVNNGYGEDAGSVVTFRFDGLAWSQEQIIAPQIGLTNAFGNSLAVTGEFAIVGAIGQFNEIIEPNGQARTYRFDGGQWASGVVISPLAPLQLSFGRSVAAHNDMFAVGGPASVDEEFIGYVFYHYNGASWIRQSIPFAGATLLSPNSIAIGDDFAAMNGAEFSYSGHEQTGIAVFRRVGNEMLHASFLRPDDRDVLGPSSVAITGTQILVGNRTNDVNGADSGAVYVFDATASNDCNNNLVPDVCELSGNDCDGNGVPDDCQFDCDSNGVIDDCEPFVDCNENGTSDACELQPDCNNNQVPDECDLDCNNNDIPDDCESFSDCNANGVPDECDDDCNNNNIPDACESIADCNLNGIPDECESDCNYNGIPDTCESLGWSESNRVESPNGANWVSHVAVEMSTIASDIFIGDSENDAAYLYSRECDPPEPPTAEAVTIFDGPAGSRYGFAVAMSDDAGNLIVGAPGADAGSDVGFANVIVGFWCFDPFHVEEVALHPPTPNAGDEFGYAVQVSDRNGPPVQFAVGAPGDDIAGTDAGAVYVFHLEWELTAWPFYFTPYGVLDQVLTASDSADGDRFGTSIAISEDLMVVSAPGAASGLSSPGVVYVFRHVDHTWTQEAKITPSASPTMAPFGPQVDAFGDRIIISMPALGSGTVTPPIGPFVYRYNGTTWEEETAFLPEPAPPGALGRVYFGNYTSVAITADLLAFHVPAYLDIYPQLPHPMTPNSIQSARWNGVGWIPEEQIPLPPTTNATMNHGLALRWEHFAFVAPDEDAVIVRRRCEAIDILGDIDADGDIDGDDANALVAVLLGAPLTPEHVSRSDLNGDSMQDGLDIGPFVDAWLAP